jgi:hypothetical protein
MQNYTSKYTDRDKKEETAYNVDAAGVGVVEVEALARPQVARDVADAIRKGTFHGGTWVLRDRIRDQRGVVSLDRAIQVLKDAGLTAEQIVAALSAK